MSTLLRNKFYAFFGWVGLLMLLQVPAFAAGPITSMIVFASTNGYEAGVSTNTSPATFQILTFSSDISGVPSAGELVTFELLSGGVVVPNGVYPSSFTTTGTAISNGGNTIFPVTFFHAGTDIQIRATSSSQTVVEPSNVFTVVASSAAKLVVLGPGMTYVPGTNPQANTTGHSGTFTTQEPNQPFTVTVILTDKQFNQVSASDQVSFSAGDFVTLPVPTTLSSGAKDVSVTMTGARMTRTITVTDNTNSAVQNGTLNITTAGPPEKEVFPFPSPFNPHRQNITFRFRLTEAKSVQLIVTDLFGQNVWKHQSSGTVSFNDVTWDGRNDAGQTVAAGAYYVMLEIDGSIESKKRFGVSK